MSPGRTQAHKQVLLLVWFSHVGLPRHKHRTRHAHTDLLQDLVLQPIEITIVIMILAPSRSRQPRGSPNHARTWLINTWLSGTEMRTWPGPKSACATSPLPRPATSCTATSLGLSCRTHCSSSSYTVWAGAAAAVATRQGGSKSRGGLRAPPCTAAADHPKARPNPKLCMGGYWWKH